MLAQIRKFRRLIVSALLCALGTIMVSCATQKQTAVVSDPDDHYDSQMPWNKQEPWESGQNFGAMTDRR